MYDFFIFRFIKILWQGSIWWKQVSRRHIFKMRLCVSIASQWWGALRDKILFVIKLKKQVSFCRPSLSRIAGGQISHPGDVQGVKFPTHVRFTESNSRGLQPPPLPLPLPHPRQPIDRCIYNHAQNFCLLLSGRFYTEITAVVLLCCAEPFDRRPSILRLFQLSFWDHRTLRRHCRKQMKPSRESVMWETLPLYVRSKRSQDPGKASGRSLNFIGKPKALRSHTKCTMSCSPNMGPFTKKNCWVDQRCI